MKIINVLVFSLILSVSLAGGNVLASSEPNFQGKIEDEMKLNIITEKLKKNGHKILCQQEDYLSCYKISEKKCMEDISSINESCVHFASEKVEEIADTKIRPKQIGKVFSTCLMMKHMSMHSSSLEGISKCMKTVKIDKAKVKKSLMD